MPRVIGIDPGTITIDVCGLDDGRVFLDASYPTRDALADPAAFIARLEAHAPLDLVAGPSGYGLPMRPAPSLSNDDLRLAYLAVDGEGGGIGGLRSLARALAASALPVVFTPGVVHLATVPAHRKVNRIDMGTADKVCATALALHEEADRLGKRYRDLSFILLELGGAFSAAVAVDHGAIVDGVGGSSGPLGMRAAGVLDGEVGYVAGTVGKEMVFGGGATSIAGDPEATIDDLDARDTDAARTAVAALVESAAKAVAALRVSAPSARTVILSGRVARSSATVERLTSALSPIAPDLEVRPLRGLGASAKEGAQGAALLADDVAAGRSDGLAAALEIHRASGTVLDHLVVISPTAARRRLGLSDA